MYPSSHPQSVSNSFPAAGLRQPLLLRNKYFMNRQ
jgi:hypothetical protein